MLVENIRGNSYIAFGFVSPFPSLNNITFLFWDLNMTMLIRLDRTSFPSLTHK